MGCGWAGYGGCSTCYGVVSSVIWTDVAVAVTVETCHGLLAEEAQGLLENWTDIYKLLF